MRHIWTLILTVLVGLALTGTAMAGSLLWEDGETLARDWQYTGGSVKGSVEVSVDFTKQGSGALKFNVLPPIPNDSWVQFKAFSTFPGDWSRFSKLTLDLYNGHNAPIWFSVHIHQGAQKTPIVEYAQEAPGWNSIALTLPKGLINVTAVEFVFNSNQSNGHAIYIDNMQLQEETTPVVERSEIRLFNLVNGSFESGLQGWIGDKAASAAAGAYFGKAGVQLANGGSVAQAMPVGDTSKAPQVGNQVEVATWVFVPVADAQPTGSVRITAEAVDAHGGKVLLGQAVADKPAVGTWFYLKTKPVAPVPASATQVVVTVKNDVQSDVYVDFVQAGTQYAVKGVPEKAVMGHLMPWFSLADNGWTHWKYGEHDPSRILENGRRDVASVYYPYIGLYDSLDPDVIDYHTDLALAMGLDVVDIDWYGFQLYPRQIDLVDRVLDAAERKGLKVSVRYEPKVHALNWVSHSNKAEVIDAVANDIIGIVKRWGSRPGYLHIDGLPVVGTFGMLMLTQDEWYKVYGKVTAAVGDIHLMGDQAPDTRVDAKNWYPMFKSTFKWSLYTPSLNNNLTALRNFVDNMNRYVKRWADADAANRFGISIIYPGFDDTPVNGWGEGARVLNPKTLDFYQVTMDSADRSGLNWALVVTLNDWNEGTIVEPSKPEFFGFSRAEATRQWVEKFKGLDSAYPLSVEEVVTGYYERIFKDRYR